MRRGLGREVITAFGFKARWTMMSRRSLRVRAASSARRMAFGLVTAPSSLACRRIDWVAVGGRPGRRAAGIGSLMPLTSSAGRLSSTTVLPHVGIGTRFRSTGLQRRIPVINRSKSVVAVKRPVHRPAGAVRDFRCPEGKATRQHSPCAARPTAAPTSLWWFRSGARPDPGRNCVGPQTRTSGLPSRLRVSGQLRGRRFPRVMPLRLKKRDVLLTPSRRSRSASRARSTWRNCEGYAS
ncbi:MAG: hypothetical protein K0Q54_4999 [Methylobacterium brachiatum]|nr:hypothetical protein [Methylobacterium brachiatum]